MVGFVRFARSPRHVSLDLGGALSAQAEGRAERVVLLVDADDADIAEAIEAIDPDMIQLHGARLRSAWPAIRARFGRPVMKAIGIAQREDLAAAAPMRASPTACCSTPSRPGPGTPCRAATACRSTGGC